MKIFCLLLLLTAADTFAQLRTSDDYLLPNERFLSIVAESSSTDFSLLGLSIDMSGESRSADYAILDWPFNLAESEVDISTPPQILPFTARATAENFGFTILGRPGQTITVEASDDLRFWRPVGVNTIAADPWSFTAPIPPAAHQFYRAVVGAP
jgi:hypothetical protein